QLGQRGGPGTSPTSRQRRGGAGFGSGERQQQARPHHGGQQRRATVGDQRQRDSGDRQHAEPRTDVHQRLHGDPRGDRGRRQRDEQVAATRGDPEPGVDQRTEQRQDA